MKQPDWEGFARAIMGHWPEGDVDGEDLQNTAEYYGLIRKEHYDPEKHGEEVFWEYGTEPGDDWYVANYPEERTETDCADAVQHERERIARMFDDLYPEWAATIRHGKEGA